MFVTRAASYDDKELARALEVLVEAAGGWDAISPPGRRAFIKPNLMAAREPGRAVTTHPAVIHALAVSLRRLGREVAIGDSPAGVVKGIRRVWEHTGAAAAAERAGIPLVSLEGSGSVTRAVNSRFVAEIRVARCCDEAAVISVPKLKTHFLTIFTGAVKNCLGVIPGLAKAELHRLAPHPDDFSELLVDLAPVLAPAFTFVDAVIGLEGDGPASGEARTFNLLIGGKNAAAVDVVLARILGFEPGEVPTVQISIERELTPAEPEIILLGLRPSDLIFDDVVPPGSLWLRRLPRPVLKFAGRQFVIRPAVTAARCTGCNKCVEACPVGAVRRKGSAVAIEDSRCIQCLCCYETCAEEAIRMQPSRAARVYYGLRDFRRRLRQRKAGGLGGGATEEK